MTIIESLLKLKNWLEWAGGRFESLPQKRELPAPLRVLWPDYSNDVYQVLEMRKTISVRGLSPSPEEIDLMDKILLLPSYIEPRGATDPKLDEGFRRRRIIWLRLITNPVTQRPKINWDKVARLESISVYKAQQYHTKGLREILAKTPVSCLSKLEEKFGQISVW